MHGVDRTETYAAVLGGVVYFGVKNRVAVVTGVSKPSPRLRTGDRHDRACCSSRRGTPKSRRPEPD